MSAGRRKERDSEKDMSEPIQHAIILIPIWHATSKIWVRRGRSVPQPQTYHRSTIHTSVPIGSLSNSGMRSRSARWMQPHDAGLPMDDWFAVPWM